MKRVHGDKTLSFQAANALPPASSVSSRGPATQAVNERRRSVLRLGLGQAQVFGAVLAFVLLLQQGPTPLVIYITVLTGLLTLVSALLFRIIWRDPPPSH